ncbi:hypothetical protein DH2020_014479 [Rehmannia glutinosa]|uniref:ceramide glucosyltransferase n=1 Tax=Rehmannia glutinosa TaxID=99300 RepID=A0ABR0WZV9_REHGL
MWWRHESLWACYIVASNRICNNIFNFVGPVESCRIPCSITIVWLRHGSSWVKLNIDDSFDCDTQLAGEEGLIRDHHGELLSAFHTLLQASSCFGDEIHEPQIDLQMVVQISTHVCIGLNLIIVVTLIHLGHPGKMSSFDSLDAFLFAASEAFCSPIALFIQIQGFFICLILAFGWSLASYVRSKEIRRIKENIEHGNNFAFLCYDINDLEHSSQVNLPRVSVVMPLKGFGEHNLHNWRTQITSLYGGPLEFLFVVESTEDPAYHAVNHLLNEYKDDVDAKIIVAGLSTTCSQKIHNQLVFTEQTPSRYFILKLYGFKLLMKVGVEKMHQDSKYVLFLDDDVRLHPGSIGALTAEMEKNPDIFIQTGYPLDLPSGSLGSYCIYEYHMPCSMGFATGGKTFFLWGGCMMMHADDFRTDRHGVVSELRDGGYSDDMTLAAIAGAHKRLIISPPVAVFPHPLATDLNFARYWNYLRKQTFVLESYTTRVNWIMNRALFSVHFYLSWGFVAPYLMSGIHVAAALRFYYKGYSVGEAAFLFSGLFLAACLAICTAIELFSMWNLTRIEVQLCNLLSPEAPPLSLASFNWCLGWPPGIGRWAAREAGWMGGEDTQALKLTTHEAAHWAAETLAVFIAMLVDNFLYPISAIRSHFSQSIDWSGIRYHLKDGKISKIERSKGKGPKYTDLGGKQLYGKKGSPNNYSFIRSLSRSFDQWRQPKKHDL